MVMTRRRAKQRVALKSVFVSALTAVIISVMVEKHPEWRPILEAFVTAVI